jgi:hypothetical protein
MNIDFGKVTMLGADRSKLAFQPLVEGELAFLAQALNVLWFLAQQEQPVGIVDGRLGRFVLVIVINRLGDRAKGARRTCGRADSRLR